MYVALTNITRAINVLVGVERKLALLTCVSACCILPMVCFIVCPIGLVSVDVSCFVCANVANAILVAVNVGSEAILIFTVLTGSCVPMVSGIGCPIRAEGVSMFFFAARCKAGCYNCKNAKKKN